MRELVIYRNRRMRNYKNLGYKVSKSSKIDTHFNLSLTKNLKR